MELILRSFCQLPSRLREFSMRRLWQIPLWIGTEKKKSEVLVPEEMPHARQASHREISQDRAQNSHIPLHERATLSVPSTQKATISSFWISQRNSKNQQKYTLFRTLLLNKDRVINLFFHQTATPKHQYYLFV